MKIDLSGLARRINDREEVIESRKGRVLAEANETCCEVVLQGQDLIRAKHAVKQGQWLDWLAVNCPRLSSRSAQQYMRLANNPQAVAMLEQGMALRTVGMLLSEGTGKEEDKEGKRWPYWIESIRRASNLRKYVERNPLDKWPEEGLVKFRAELQPIFEWLSRHSSRGARRAQETAGTAADRASDQTGALQLSPFGDIS